MAKTKLNLPPSLFLEDGTEVRLLPLEKTGGKALYVSADGRCFSYFRCVLRLAKPQADTSKTNRFNAHRKQKYLRMTRYGNILVHIAVATVWIGPRLDGYECDHLNGITTDNRVENLQWVTPAENRKRAKILRCMRDAGNDPKQYSTARLKAIFAQYSLMDGAQQMKREMSKHCEE